jgi:hypothetical protein
MCLESILYREYVTDFHTVLEQTPSNVRWEHREGLPKSDISTSVQRVDNLLSRSWRRPYVRDYILFADLVRRNGGGHNIYSFFPVTYFFS